MNCPHCGAHLRDDVTEVVDTPTGIVAVSTEPAPTRRAFCPCGWGYRVTSVVAAVTQPELLVEVA